MPGSCGQLWPRRKHGSGPSNIKEVEKGRQPAAYLDDAHAVQAVAFTIQSALHFIILFAYEYPSLTAMLTDCHSIFLSILQILCSYYDRHTHFIIVIFLFADDGNLRFPGLKA